MSLRKNSFAVSLAFHSRGAASFGTPFMAFAEQSSFRGRRDATRRYCCQPPPNAWYSRTRANNSLNRAWASPSSAEKALVSLVKTSR